MMKRYDDFPKLKLLLEDQYDSAIKELARISIEPIDSNENKIQVSYKIETACGLLGEALKELTGMGIDLESDLMRYLKDAVLASDHAYDSINSY